MNRAKRILPFSILISAITLALAGCEPSTSSPPGTSNPANTSSPKTGEEVIQSFAKLLADQKSFSCDISSLASGTVGGQKIDEPVEQTVKFARPNHVALGLTSGKTGIALYCDGKDLAFCSPNDKRYSVTSAPENFEALVNDAHSELGMLGDTDAVLPAILTADPAKRLLDGAKVVKLVGVEEIDGTKCNHVRVETKDNAWDVWIDAGAQPLVRQFKPDVAKMFEAAGQKGQENDLKIVVDFKNWKLGAQIPEADFAFTPAAGMEQVDSLLGASHDEPLSKLLGEPAPPFKAPLLDGSELDLSRHLGKDIIVLDFWATWCPPCVRGLPIVAEVTGAFRDKGVVLYAVNQQEKADEIKKFLEDKKLDITVTLDAEGAIANLYQLGDGIPQTVIIGKDGTVQVVHLGLLPDMKQRLTREIEALLAGKNLAAETKAKAAAKAAEKPLSRAAPEKEIDIDNPIVSPQQANDSHATGMEMVWNLPEAWQGAAADDKAGVLYASTRDGGILIDAEGNRKNATPIAAVAGIVRSANLIKDSTKQLLCFQPWGSELSALDAEGNVLWKHSANQGINDVWPADLTSDGIDEIIVAYNGDIGLQALDAKGQVLWTNQKLSNVAHVCAGDINNDSPGDGNLEIVCTTGAGKVHVLNAGGEIIKEITPAASASMIRVAGPNDGQPTQIIVCGTDQKTTVVESLDLAGTAKWKTQINGKVVESAAIAPKNPWIAIAVRGGEVSVLDLETGKSISQVGDQGEFAQVAWFTPNEKAPLLIVASGQQLNAFRMNGR